MFLTNFTWTYEYDRVVSEPSYLEGICSTSLLCKIHSIRDINVLIIVENSRVKKLPFMPLLALTLSHN